MTQEPMFTQAPSKFREIIEAKKVMENEANAIKKCAEKIDENFPKALDILAEIHQKTPISTIITKSTFRPVYQAIFQEIKQSYNLELLPDYFLSTDNYLQPAKRFFQYWNKVKKNLKY